MFGLCVPKKAAAAAGALSAVVEPIQQVPKQQQQQQLPTDATGACPAAMAPNSTQTLAQQCLDLRHAGMPSGKCVYLMAGDPGDFDGYLIAVAGAEVEQHTKDFQLAVVVPERRACPDRSHPDVNAHDPEFSEQIMTVVGRLMRLLCPTTMLVRGTLNTRNVIPLKFVFSEPEKYGPLVEAHDPAGAAPTDWQSLQQLAALVEDPGVSSVVLDMNGAIGFLSTLKQECPSLGPKLKASGLPVCVMAGIRAEHESMTLRVPGRDPRATMNALYDAAAVRHLLDLAAQHTIPLLFVTNNVCNEVLKYEGAAQLAEELGLQGLLLELAQQWYGPHLAGKCVPFDWVSLCALLLYKQQPGLLRLETRQLYVGAEDASIMVLLDPGLPRTPVVESQLEGTQLWGEVQSLVAIDKDAMVQLAKHVASKHVV